MSDRPALLALEDGSLFRGRSIGAVGTAVGEVVFNTSMTGYQEVLTDPSYAKQIITFTYPHIGNVGVNVEDEESARVYASGLVVRNLPEQPSSWRAQFDLPDYLARQNVVGIADVDTRKLTRILRQKGAQNGAIVTGEMGDGAAIASEAIAAAKGFPGLEGMDLAKEVTTNEVYGWSEGVWSAAAGGGQTERSTDVIKKRFLVLVYDFGVKRNILRILYEHGCEIEVVPATTSAKEVLDRRPDGVFLSNGPGDPAACDYAILAVREIVAQGVPTFGICLGHQLLGLACGADTVKMKFGHHGANHPVRDVVSGEVMISSQNHGFVIDEDSLPEHLQVTHRSLFDHSVQGIRHVQMPAYSFQGHPEASPGPRDARRVFGPFMEMMEGRRVRQENHA